MWNPLSRKPSIPRTAAGTFASKEPSESAKRPVEKAVEGETKAIGAVVDVWVGINKLMESQEKIISERVAQAVAAGPEEPGESALEWILPVLETLMPHIGPYIPAIMSKLGIESRNNGHGAPESSPALPAAPQIDAKNLIEGAARTPVSLLKVGMPKILDEVEKVGIDREVFKKAIQHMNKAL